MSHGLADFSKKLQLVLDALSTSRSQLAHDLGVHKSLVARWVAGDVTPTEHNLSRLTLLIKQTRPDFSLAVWRHDVVAFAEAVGVSRREIERLSGGSAPAAPARSPACPSSTAPSSRSRRP
jgi:plasmid maintenance system antidote protein VapI